MTRRSRVLMASACRRRTRSAGDDVMDATVGECPMGMRPRARFTCHMVTRLLAVLALVAVAGTVGYMAGHTTVKRADKGWMRGFETGTKAKQVAVDQARRSVEARYRRGAGGYDRIYTAGRREGRRL